MYQKLRLFFILLLVTCSVHAQVNLSAHVDKNALALDDELTFTVKVTGVSGNVVMPRLPSLPAFNVYSREVEQNTINGETSLLFRYIMLPRFVGNATIGPVTFTYKGETYQTEPVTVRIYRNSTNQATTSAGNIQTNIQIDPNLPPLQAELTKQAYAHSGEPFFLISAVSDKTPYVNEPISLGVRFYYSRAFHDAPYQKPNVSNLFMEDEGSSEGSQAINGTTYRYNEQRYQVTAASPGEATIGPAGVRYHIGNSALSAFDRIFGGSTAGPEKTALSSPITLRVRPLPAEGRPNSFYGAVGNNFMIHAKAEPTHVRAGEAINVSVMVKGPGNLKATQNLEFPALDGFKIYPAAATSGTANGSDGQIQGYKIFKAVFVPVTSGIYTLPRFKWSYFDPTAKAYRTLQTSPIQITVDPAAKTDGGFNFASANPLGNGVQTLTQDIAYLKTAKAPQDNALAKLSRVPIINWICLIIMALTALFVALGRAPLAKKKAFLTAKAQLKKATSCQAVADIISEYLQRKLRRPTGSLSLKELNILLRKSGVTPATVESFALLWQQLEAERFAPVTDGTASAVDLPSQALDILKLIEEEMK
ncbi:BatD family protein [Candidatus Avelusimicrobium luingense]|uniref:BatD family protein n=1 Tax=Candidatus Avelusimicrobium luingense TaxID=3416211 RepID=UPI003D111546